MCFSPISVFGFIFVGLGGTIWELEAVGVPNTAKERLTNMTLSPSCGCGLSCLCRATECSCQGTNLLPLWGHGYWGEYDGSHGKRIPGKHTFPHTSERPAGSWKTAARPGWGKLAKGGQCRPEPEQQKGQPGQGSTKASRP